MPKQIYKIENFHGGLNSNSDPRDIADSQSPDCNDVAINNVGRITLMGKDSNTGNVLDYGNDLPCVYNSGLFSYSHDYRISDGSEGSEFLYVNYDGTDDVEVTGSDGDNLDFSLSSNAFSYISFHKSFFLSSKESILSKISAKFLILFSFFSFLSTLSKTFSILLIINP